MHRLHRSIFNNDSNIRLTLGIQPLLLNGDTVITTAPSSISSIPAINKQKFTDATPITKFLLFDMITPAHTVP